MSLADVKNIPILDIAGKLGLSLRPGMNPCFNGHDKKSPSLSVNVSKNLFHCFGACGIGGSGIDLVMSRLGVNEGDAIRWIEKEYSLESDKTGTKRGKADPCYSPTPKTPLTAPREAPAAVKTDGKAYAGLYRDLLALADIGEAVKYLEGRGLRQDITERAGVSMIPKDNTAIKKELFTRHGLDRLKAAGIVAESKRTGKPYFVFNCHRLIIPYYDMDGDIVNLQGRNVDTAADPKYMWLCGIDTTLYNVRVLKDIKPGETVYLCEGAIDALTCLQLGFDYPVAVAGVHNFKPAYYDLLEPYKLIIASDADTAGTAFYLRVKKEYLKRGKEIYALDYSLIKSDYNVAGYTKDLNDIAQQADYEHAKELQGTLSTKYYVSLFNEYFTMQEGGGIIFDSGVRYSKQELEKMDGLPQDDLKAIHLIKQTLTGELIL
jgi:DNA primase